MPGYITKNLQRFIHPIPKKSEHPPHYHVQPKHGTKAQLTEPGDKTPLLQPYNITKLQQTIGAVLYHDRDVDGTLTTTFN